MRSKKWPCYLVVLMLLLTFSGCVPVREQTLKDQKFNEIVSDIPTSGYFKFVVLDSPNGIDSKTIGVENTSNSELVIPLLFDKLYTFDNTEQKWISIPEQTVFDEPIYLYPKEDVDKGQSRAGIITIEPDLSKLKKPISVRVLIIGEIIENGQNTGKQVGGYIDLEFQ